jgi:hypothetical protein
VSRCATVARPTNVLIPCIVRLSQPSQIQMEPRPLKGEKLELWQQLCAMAAVEQDPQKLIELVREINRLLGEKQDQLNREKAEKKP